MLRQRIYIYIYIYIVNTVLDMFDIENMSYKYQFFLSPFIVPPVLLQTISTLKSLINIS